MEKEDKFGQMLLDSLNLSVAEKETVDVTRMTNKEAKTVLVNLTYLFKDEEILEALDVAISALSVEYVQVEADTLPPKVPLEWITQGMILLPRKDYEKLRKGLEEWQSVADMPQTEPSDLISRAEAVKAIKAFIKDEVDLKADEDDEEHEHDIGYLCGLHRGELIIKDLPSVSAERVGVWIDYGGDSWTCSNCGVETYTSEDFRREDKRAYQMNYCHYCGARMENTK